jgi:hypothetical protein
MANTPIPATAVSEERHIDKGPIAAPRNKETRKPVTAGSYRFPEGLSLSDVINRAYKPPPIHIDLTLDESDVELVTDVPASVRHNARLLDELLASDNEETGKREVVPRKCTLIYAFACSLTVTACFFLSDWLES